MLAILMIATAGLAYAQSTPEDMDDETGVIGEFQSADTPDTPAKDSSVIIYKEFTVYNKSSDKVYAPVIEYDYSIAPVAAGKNIYDSKTKHDPQTSVHAVTLAGPAGAKIYGSVDGTNFVENKLSLTNAGTNAVEFDSSNTGASNKYKLKLDFSGCRWTQAGVYRFVITEHVNSKNSDADDTSEKNKAGIADGTITNQRYVDVYVKRATAETYEIYGYTCFAYNNDIDARDSAATNDTVEKAYKTEGFVSGTDSSTNSAVTADTYYTFDLTISKTLVGDAAMNMHKFPFTVDFTNDSVTATIRLKQTTVAGGGITANVPAAGAVSSLDVANTDLQIANGASVTYVGIPVGITSATTVAVYENNDVAGTTYESKYQLDQANEAAVAATIKNIDWNNPADSSKSNIATLNTLTKNTHDSNSAHTIAYTNTLKLISPTGVVLRVAPYLLMLAAGIALLVIFMAKRRKHHEEE